MADSNRFQLRSSTAPKAPPLMRQVICKLAKKYHVDLNQLLPFTLPEEEECLTKIENLV